MKPRPISWPYGGRFAITAANHATNTVTIEGKRWPWSRPEVVSLEFCGGRWFWCDTHTELVLAPQHAFSALMRAVNQ